MAFIHHDQIILINRRRIGGVIGEQHPFDETLDGADMQASFFIRLHVFKALHAEQLAKCLWAFDGRAHEFVAGLFAQRGTVHNEADVAETLGGQQAV